MNKKSFQACQTTRRKRARAAPGLLLALTLAACGGGSEVLLIPLFEFGFSATVGATQLQLFLNPDNPSESTGTFAFVNMNIDADQVSYTGTWSGCTFSISTNEAVNAPVAASYSGAFMGNDTIRLTPTSGNGLPTVTMQRQGVGTRQTGC